MSQQDQDAWKQQTMPGPEHQALAPFVGKFKGKVRMHMQPGAPPAESEGIMTTAWTLDGRFLEQSYDGQAFGGVFKGRGFFGFNRGSRKYQGVWIDTASTCMQTESGTYDPTTKTFTMSGTFDNPADGSPMHKKSVFKVLSNDEHTLEMFFPGPDGKDFKIMDIHYTRVK